MGSINRLARQRKVISRPDYATKSYMAGASVDHLRMPRRRTVPSAVVRRTEIRATLDHLARDTDTGLRRVVAEGLQAALGIARHAARPLGFRRMTVGIPVGGPFPDIADHVVETVAIGRERSDRRAANKTVQAVVAVREGTLPCVCHVAAVWCELVPPGEHGALPSAPGSKLPFGFGGQRLSGPSGV